MKRTIFAVLLSIFLYSCGPDGTVIEVKEQSPNKFVVIDEREADDSYVIIHYLDGRTKTMTFEQAESYISANPPSPPSSSSYSNYNGGHNQGGIDLSDMMLYHMMFGGFGGSNHTTHIIERYPTYYNTIQPAPVVNYPSRRRNKPVTKPPKPEKKKQTKKETSSSTKKKSSGWSLFSSSKKSSSSSSSPRSSRSSSSSSSSSRSSSRSSSSSSRSSSSRRK